MSELDGPPAPRDPSTDEPDAAPGLPPTEGGGVGFAAIPNPAQADLSEVGRAAEPSPAVPPPASPTGSVAPHNPMEPMSPPEPPKKSPVKLIGVFLAVAGAALGAIFVKFVLPLILVGAAGAVFDGAFGGPYMRLPNDVRDGFEARLKTVVGTTLDDQSEAEQTASILALVEGGLPRLDDGLVGTNFRLTAKAIGAVDVASCAAVSRAFVVGGEPPVEPVTAMINTLSDVELQQWFEIRVSAIEAEVRGTPDQVLVAEETVAPLYDELFEIMDPAHIETIGQLANSQTVEDAPLCAAIRGLYDAVLTLSAEETTLFARYDVSP